jgi:hypothetical protein
MAEEPRPVEESSSVFESSHSIIAEAKIESAEEPKLKIAAEQLKALSPLQDTAIEGTKDCCNNSKEEEDGQRTRRCYRICKGVDSCLST